MNNKGKIIKMICPHCQRHEMDKFEKVIQTGFNSCRREYTWRCPDCVYIYSEMWLNDPRFTHIERFVLRDEESLADWKKLNRWGIENGK